MSRLPKATGKEVLAVLQRKGFVLTHVRGSHHYLRKSGVGGLVVVPVHGNHTLPVGTLRSILRQAGLTAEDLEVLL
ncbi:MAG: type II toxin-antitoxin system HicA family toxin [Acidobacteriota bacterium]